VILVPDADLGGARIASRVLAAIRKPANATLVDIGAHSHPNLITAISSSSSSV